MNAKRALLGSWSASALACLGVALPKCPLCLAACLCLFGLSASSARTIAQHGLLLCLTGIALCTLATALFVARRGRRALRATAKQAVLHCACRSVTPKAEARCAVTRDHQLSSQI